MECTIFLGFWWGSCLHWRGLAWGIETKMHFINIWEAVWGNLYVLSVRKLITLFSDLFRGRRPNLFSHKKRICVNTSYIDEEKPCFRFIILLVQQALDKAPEEGLACTQAPSTWWSFFCKKNLLQKSTWWSFFCKIKLLQKSTHSRLRREVFGWSTTCCLATALTL